MKDFFFLYDKWSNFLLHFLYGCCQQLVGDINYRSEKELQRIKEDAKRAQEEAERYKEIARKSGLKYVTIFVENFHV